MDLDDVVREWTDSFTLETLEFSCPEEVTDEEVFADIYNALIHSAKFSSTLIQLEQSYAETINEKCVEKDEEFKVMDKKHAEEMKNALEKDQSDDLFINDLASKHTEERQLKQSYWESQLDNLRQVQKREFRDWVMCVFEEMKVTNTAQCRISYFNKEKCTLPFT